MWLAEMLLAAGEGAGRISPAAAGHQEDPEPWPEEWSWEERVGLDGFWCSLRAPQGQSLVKAQHVEGAADTW